MKRETDFTYPNPPNDIPSKGLMQMAKDKWGSQPFALPWPRKPLGKPTKGKPGPKTSRSGVHTLGKPPKRKSSWY